MQVKVIGSSNPDCWYSECIGQVFEVLEVPAPVVWFNSHLFFLSQDVQLIKTKRTGWLPVLTHFGIS